MALKGWEKFLKQNQFLKEILDTQDTLREEITSLKAENRKLQGKIQGVKSGTVLSQMAQIEKAMARVENENKKLRAENSYLKQKYNYNPEEDNEWD